MGIMNSFSAGIFLSIGCLEILSEVKLFLLFDNENKIINKLVYRNL